MRAGLFILAFISFQLLFGQNMSNVQLLKKRYETIVDSLNIARQNRDFNSLAKSYYQLGLFEERSRRNFERSFDYLSRALEYYKLVKDSTGIQNTRFHMARHLMENAMYDDALDEFQDLKKYYNRNVNSRKAAQIELQLFKIYFNELDIKSAEKALKNAGRFFENSENSTLQLQLLGEQIQYYDFVQELDTAMILAKLCINKSIAANESFYEAQCLASRGNVLIKMSDYDQAIMDYKKSLTVLNNIPYSKDRLEVYKNISACYDSLDDFRNAYIFSNYYSQLQDSILNENRVIAVNTVTNKFESRQKSTEIKLLEKEKAFAEESNKQQRRALTVLAIALAGLLLGLYYIVRFYKEKIETARIIEKQNEEINRQKINELQDKIQINSMQSMINGQEIERERIAKDLHDSLGGLLSTIKLKVDNIKNKESDVRIIPDFQSATSLLDTAVSEVRSISQNLQPGALSRLGLIPAVSDLINRYDSEDGPDIIFQHFDIPTKLDQKVALVIYRIIQEILNNAIKHAGASEILVQLNREHEDIIIHIEDDGIGFDPELKYDSMGLENIRSRVNYLKGTIEIDSRKNEGTSFLIHVKSTLI
jgi:signal transduction histidine kinase